MVHRARVVKGKKVVVDAADLIVEQKLIKPASRKPAKPKAKKKPAKKPVKKV